MEGLVHMHLSLERRVCFLRALCWLLVAKETCAEKKRYADLEELCFSLRVVSSRKDHSIIKQFKWNRTSGDLPPKLASSRPTLTATFCCSEQLKHLLHALDLQNVSAS